MRILCQSTRVSLFCVNIVTKTNCLLFFLFFPQRWSLLHAAMLFCCCSWQQLLWSVILMVHLHVS